MPWLTDIQAGPERLYIFHCQDWRQADIPTAWFMDLDPLEQQRAPSHRIQHVLRRHILAACCGVAPADIQYDRRADKPRLYNTEVSDFSVSHTADDLVVAVVFAKQCGVDYERPRSLLYGKAIAERFFTEQERLIWQQRDYDPHYFFRMWTLKEAAVKCVGSGMFSDAKHYDFSTEQVIYKQHMTDMRRLTEKQAMGYFSVVFTGRQRQCYYRQVSLAKNHSEERIIDLDRKVAVDLGAK